MANGVPDEITQPGQFQFSPDGRSMRLDRFYADAEDTGDLLVALALDKKLQGLSLTAGKGLGRPSFAANRL